jgi:hypothetical protein
MRRESRRKRKKRKKDVENANLSKRSLSENTDGVILFHLRKSGFGSDKKKPLGVGGINEVVYREFLWRVVADFTNHIMRSVWPIRLLDHRAGRNDGEVLHLVTFRGKKSTIYLENEENCLTRNVPHQPHLQAQVTIKDSHEAKTDT